MGLQHRCSRMALAVYPVGVEHDFISREEAIERTLKKLRFFADSEQSKSPTATGYKGFYYHFLDMQTGRRAWQCELSTIDSTFLFAGMLAAAAYFDRDSEEESEIRRLADELYRRAVGDGHRQRCPSLHGWSLSRASSLSRGHLTRRCWLIHASARTHPLAAGYQTVAHQQSVEEGL